MTEAVTTVEAWKHRALAAEKRADEVGFKLADDQFWKLKAEQAESERDEAIARWREDIARLHTALAERDEALTRYEGIKAELTLVMQERYEARAALVRMMPVYDAALEWCQCYLTEGNKSSEGKLREAVCSALSHTKGDGR